MGHAPGCAFVLFEAGRLHKFNLPRPPLRRDEANGCLVTLAHAALTHKEAGKSR
jgi:hypothetical protein